MSAAIITNAGLAAFALNAANGTTLNIDRFLLANIAGLDPDTAANPNEALPIVADRVGEFPVSSKGYVTPSQVVYSLLLDPAVGDFQFNWVGLLANDDTLLAVRYINPVEKFATNGGDLGNTLVRNFLLTYSDAQSITNVTVEASSWQFNFAIVDNLTTTDNARPLSAQQGVVLRELIEALAAAEHNHDGDYSPNNHNHDAQYSPANHSHSDLANKTHGHNASDISGVFDPDSLPNGSAWDRGILYKPVFSNSAFSGYHRCLETGMIMQWGFITAPPDTTNSYAFPLTFPNACRSLVTDVKRDSTAGTNQQGLYGFTDGSFSYDNLASISTAYVRYIAIGY